MFALINLFICVLKFPTAPTSNSDLALLDMVAGHFGHMEFITTSELSFPFAREAASLARKVVKTAAEPVSENLTESSLTTDLDTMPLGFNSEPFGNVCKPLCENQITFFSPHIYFAFRLPPFPADRTHCPIRIEAVLEN